MMYRFRLSTVFLKKAPRYLSRKYRVSPCLFHQSSNENRSTSVHVEWEGADGTRTETKAFPGDSLLQVAHKNNIPLEGACEGSIACSTCHVILEKAVFDQLPEASEEEDDMLDMAYGLTMTYALFVTF